MEADRPEPKLQLPDDRPPFFVGAGIIKSANQIRQYARIPELAALVIGDFSDKQNYPRGRGQRFYYDEITGAAYNAFRLRNPGRKAAGKYLSESIKIVHDAGQLAIVGIVPLKHENPLLVVPDMTEWALEMGADGVEINTSCPNEDSDELLCYDILKTRHAVRRARQRVGEDPYLSVKLSALTRYQTNRHRDGLVADGVCIINSDRQMSPTNPETGLPFIEVNDGYAGRSGSAINGLARRNLRNWLQPAGETVEFPVRSSRFDVWSIGGIKDGYEAYDRRENIGAFAVGGAQAFFRADNPAEVAKRWAAEYEEAGSLPA